MNNTQHTPGPLRIEGTHLVDDIAEEPLPHAVIRDSTERWVALVEITDDEGLGNAHLIAAAPAMYEALKLLTRVVQSYENPMNIVTSAQLDALKAIAIAEGREHV